MMVQRVVVNSWEQTKAELEAHGEKKAERITKVVEETGAGLASLVEETNKLGHARVSAMGPEVRDAVVERLASSLDGIRGAQTDMRSEIGVSWWGAVAAQQLEACTRVAAKHLCGLPRACFQWCLKPNHDVKLVFQFCFQFQPNHAEPR
jgi:hypothetical protein